MKQVSQKIVGNGGIVRSIQNHGIRKFPHRIRAKHPDFQTGQRYYEKGRYISVYYDANPGSLKDVEKILDLSDNIVLRQTHLKVRSKLDWISMERIDKSPYMEQVLKQEKEVEANQKAEEMAIETGVTSGDAVVETMKED
jgi:ribosomal protein S6